MTVPLSPTTKAVLLLTAPLRAGRNEPSPDLLKPREYRELVRHLERMGREPADLLTSDPADFDVLRPAWLDYDRLRDLLGRSFLLSLAISRWHQRGIWVLSTMDPEYPKRLKERLGTNAPPLLYGCGDPSVLDAGGLAVVGSRNVDEPMLQYARAVGSLAAHAGLPVVSGGARGIDNAAMEGALEEGGRVTGVLSAELERLVLRPSYRGPLSEHRLVLVSPFDPSAGFTPGNAMSRNKLIYALADAALVVSVGFKEGGTWAGASEQLRRGQFCPVYIRSVEQNDDGVEALLRKGALPWPAPQTTDELVQLVKEARQADDTELPSGSAGNAQLRLLP